MKIGIVGLAVLAAATLGTTALSAQTKALRVCADPDYLPFSNQAGEGFENKVAAEVAKALGEKLEYTWQSYRGRGGFPEFMSRTLEAQKCDVVMDIPYGSREELTTKPYYVSSYVFVYKKEKDYDIRSLDSATLRQLKIGFEEDTPVEDGLKMRGLIDHTVSFDVGSDSTESPLSMVEAVEKGRIDVLITWQPAIGNFLRDYPDLEVAPVPNARTLGPPEQYVFPMAMAVREGDDALQAQLDGVISKHQAELNSILDRYGVKLYEPPNPNEPQ